MLIDSCDDDDVAETAAEEIEDEEPAVSEMVSEAEHDGEETVAESVFADDAPEMDEFEAALTKDLMAANDVSDEFDETHEDEPQVAEDRVTLRLEQPVEEERIPLRKPRVHVINVSPAPAAEQTEEEETDNVMNDVDAPQPVAVRRPTRPVAKTRRKLQSLWIQPMCHA